MLCHDITSPYEILNKSISIYYVHDCTSICLSIYRKSKRRTGVKAKKRTNLE